MANTHHIPDDVLRNILARLPGKPLLRFRCVSKHWNGLISDPYFMKSRSRRMILLQFTRPLVAIDDNEAYHAVELPHSPLEHEEENTQVSIVGTLNGIVLLALIHSKSLRIPSRFKLVLYNPLTCASRIVAVMGRTLVHYHPYVFGFGYGATKDDLKIVRFEYDSYHPNGLQYKFDVFDLKTCSWSTQSRYLTIKSHFRSATGTFLKGFLYWLTLSSSYGILALDVKEMVFSNIKLPDELTYVKVTLLGSVGGCLCVVNKVGSTGFDVWLMKEECSWMKAHSFTFPLERRYFYPICILDNGQILIKSTSHQFVIYDTSNDSHKPLKGFPTLDDIKGINTSSDYKMRYIIYHYYDLCSIEYVESLVSPSYMCFN